MGELSIKIRLRAKQMLFSSLKFVYFFSKIRINPYAQKESYVSLLNKCSWSCISSSFLPCSLYFLSPLIFEEGNKLTLIWKKKENLFCNQIKYFTIFLKHYLMQMMKIFSYFIQRKEVKSMDDEKQIHKIKLQKQYMYKK